MKNLGTLLFFCLLPFSGYSQKIITNDVYNFWKAYDKIITEKDTLKQLNLIQTLYIDKGTPGLKGIMKARNYSAKEYVYAINHYPQFWNSVRQNTQKANQFSKHINVGIVKLKNIYPELQPVNTYFEIGILRTGGTTIDKMLLIGSEIALADKHTITDEIDAKYPHLRKYFNTEPIKDVVFLNTHEYIHTQQKETIGKILLSQTVIEGVAEFLAEIALNKKSPNPQIAFGFKNEEAIKKEYEKEMFSSNIYNWIMNNDKNQFGIRDLGYFIGYAICKKYYNSSLDKKLAVKEMIDLDYNNDIELIKFVEKSKYFDQPLSFYKDHFEKERPKVIEIKPFINGDKNVDPNIKIITLNFSQPMNVKKRGFDYGSLGENNVLKVQKVIGFTEDKKSFSFEVMLEPNKRYQCIVNDNFMDINNYPLKPFLIDFTTADK